MKNNTNKIVIYTYTYEAPINLNNKQKKKLNKELEKQWTLYNFKIKQFKF